MFLHVINIFYFLSIIILLTLTGNTVLKVFKLNFKSPLENLLFSLMFSLVVISLMTYTVLFLRLQILVVPIYWIFTTVGFTRLVAIIRKKANLKLRVDWWFVLPTLFVSLLMISVTARSGWQTESGVWFFGANVPDGFLHLSLIGELKNHFPPQHPNFSGIYLKEYHYLLDLILAKFSLIFGFNETDLYFRFFPFLAAIMWCGTTFIFAKQYFKSRAIALLAIFFSLFGGGFAYLLPIFHSNAVNLDGAFGVSSPITSLVNLHFSLSIAILMLSFIAFVRFLQEENLGWGLTAVLFISVLFGFKIYAGIIALLTIGLSTIFYLARTKKFKILWVIFSSAILSILAYLPLSTRKTGLVFAPGEMVQHIVRGPFSWTLWEIQRQIYAQHNNFLGLAKLKFIAFSVFIIGNLGTRVLGLGEIIKFSKSPILKGNFGIFPTALILSFFFPLIFIQAITPFNIIQFWWYFMYFMSFLAAAITWQILKEKTIIVKFILLVIIVILTIPSSVVALSPYFMSKDSYGVSHQKLSALKFLKEISSPDDVILEIPYGVLNGNLNFDFSSIPAFSQRRVFLGRELIEFSYLDTKTRVKEMEKIIAPLNCSSQNIDKFCREKISLSQKVILENKINYVFSNQTLFWLEDNNKISSLIYNQDQFYIYKIK